MRLAPGDIGERPEMVDLDEDGWPILDPNDNGSGIIEFDLEPEEDFNDDWVEGEP